MWSNLGAAPKPEEIEVTVIGPGHGESVVVHLGGGEWLVVDSCVDTIDDERRAAPLRYLRTIGVPVETAVKLVVISHWDDDHVRGVAEVVETCARARLSCSLSITKRDFGNFVEALSIGSVATNGANVREIRRILDILEAREHSILAATPGRVLLAQPKVMSWSPSDHEGMLFLQFVAQGQPVSGRPLRRAVPGSPNLTSVVLSIDWHYTSVLLGADMETHSDNRRGWGAIVGEAGRIGFSKGTLVKIPHHGSHTGHDDRMWSALLQPGPVSIIAPFGRGPVRQRPPKSSDVRRINGLSSVTFLTAKRGAHAAKRKEVAVVRSLREGMIRLSSTKAPIGIVRARRMPGAVWQYDMFGSARRAK